MRGAPPGYPMPVFMYHDLADEAADVPSSHRPYVLEVGQFRDQMRALAQIGARGFRLDESDGVGLGAAAGALPVVITFDDGHASNCTRALPLLQETGFRATFFVTAGWIGSPGHVDRVQVRELAAGGMEIGSHSMTHRPPSSLGRAELDREMADSKKRLEDILAAPIASASSPTGFFNPAILGAARAAGYRFLCAGRIGLWRSPAAGLGIPRIPVKQSTPTAHVVRCARRDAWLIGTLRGKQVVRQSFKHLLGIDNYLRLRRALLGMRGTRP